MSFKTETAEVAIRAQDCGQKVPYRMPPKNRRQNPRVPIELIQARSPRRGTGLWMHSP